MSATHASQPRRALQPDDSGAAQSSEAGRRARGKPVGVWGMALFLCSEATIFGTLLATYFYLDFDNARWPPAGIRPPSVMLPLISTGVLLLTSIPMWRASRAARAGARTQVTVLVTLALVVQCCYLAGQILLFRHDLNHFRPQDTAYGSIYFTILAADHAHVLLGILIDAVVLAYVTLRGLTNYWTTGVRGLAIYWHVVNVITVLVTLTQLSPSL
jgi:heme/copper-type cytochrome/quinol oxidase subunit 3